MIKRCTECGRPLKCAKCRKAGAFGKDGDKYEPHDGECVYEHCKFCQEVDSAKCIGDGGICGLGGYCAKCPHVKAIDNLRGESDGRE